MKLQQINLKFPEKSWHYRKLEELAAEADLPITTVAKDLLKLAIEQCIDEEPEPDPEPVHIQRFREN